MNYLVSIIVPVYNMAQSIEQCVESLLNQDYANIEIILVDDGSKDNSYEICRKISEKDNRVRVIHTENRGSGPARNTGIDNAKGEYVYFPDADDYLESNAISSLVEATNDGEFDLIVFGYRNANPDGSVISEKKYQPKASRASIIREDYSEYMTNAGTWCIQGAPWNKFFSLSIIREYSIYFPSLRRHQDEGFIGRFMCYAKNVRFISDVLYIYYVNDLQMEWKKYPIDYIDAVIGLYNVRKETILTWNKNDIVTHDMVIREYICNVIKSLELAFSPKMGFTYLNRKKWIIKALDKSELANYTMPERFDMPYQKMCLKLVKANHLNMLYTILKGKVLMQKNLKSVHRRRKS